MASGLADATCVSTRSYETLLGRPPAWLLAWLLAAAQGQLGGPPGGRRQRRVGYWTLRTSSDVQVRSNNGFWGP